MGVSRKMADKIDKNSFDVAGYGEEAPQENGESGLGSPGCGKH